MTTAPQHESCRQPKEPAQHLQHVLAEYALIYFNTARPHQGIGQQTPVSGERLRTRFAGSVTAIPLLGGLHHDYCAAA
jgi:hypothetical protein